MIIEETDGTTDVVESRLTDSYTIVLGFPPTSDVTVTVDDSGESFRGKGFAGAFPLAGFGVKIRIPPDGPSFYAGGMLVLIDGNSWVYHSLCRLYNVVGLVRAGAPYHDGSVRQAGILGK